MQRGRPDRLAQRGLKREPVEIDAERGPRQFRVVAAAESGRDLDHLRAFGTDPKLRIRGAVLDAQRLDRGARHLRRLAAGLTRPDMRKCHTERGRLGRQAVGHGEGVEISAHGEGVDCYLRPVHELLDDRDAATGFLDRPADRCRELLLRPHERKPLLSLTVGCFHHRRHRQSRLGLGHELPARLRDTGFREPFALLELGDSQSRGRPVDRMRQSHALGDARGDPDRPIDARRDDPLHPLGGRKALDTSLVLGRDDRPPVGEAESGRCRVAVERDHEEPPLARRSKEPELSGSRP